MPPESTLRWSARRTNPLSASPIIAVVGSMTKDIIFETDRMPNLGESVASNSLTIMHGGKGANIAIAAYRASHRKPKPTSSYEAGKSAVKPGDIRVFMNGAVGVDDFGPQLKKGLSEKGIDVSGVQELANEQTGQVVVIVEKQFGESRSLGFKGANLNFRPPTHDDVECLTGDTGLKPDILITHLTLTTSTVEQMLATAWKNGVETILSASPAVHLVTEAYRHITHVILNQHEAAELTDRNAKDFEDIEIAQQAASSFIDRGVKYAIITLGKAGSVYAMDTTAVDIAAEDTLARKKIVTGYIPAETKVKVKDDTGAGDSFLGAYAAEYVRQKQKGFEIDIEKAITFATKAAACTIEQLGSQTALPWLDDIERKE